LLGAQVRLYDTGTEVRPSRFDIYLTTDVSGKAVYDFSNDYKNGQAGFTVLDISANKGGLFGEAIIKIDEEVNNEALVQIE
jgi:hypothetical protein